MSGPHVFESIVVGLDEVGRSDPAARVALELGERLGIGVKLVHAVEEPVSFLDRLDHTERAAHHSGLLAAAWKAQVKRLGPVLEDAGRENGEVENLLTVVAGNPAKALLNIADDEQDLIVIGPHERQGVLDFGSTARAILSHVHGSVWVQKHEPRPIRRLLVPIDLSEDSERTLGRARALARALEATMDVFHAFAPPALAYPPAAGEPVRGPSYVVDDLRRLAREGLEEMVEKFDWQGVPHREVFVEGDPVETIVEEAKTRDLVVMGTHGHTGLSAVVLGNVAYAVIKRTDTPVLALRHPDRHWLL